MDESKHNPIRVLQLWSYYLPIFAGGAIRYNQLNPWLRDQGVEIEVLTPRRENTLKQETVNGTPVSRIYAGPVNQPVVQSFVSSFPMLWRLWRQRDDYDIAHDCSSNAFFAFDLLLIKLSGKPVIIDFTVMASGKQSIIGKLLYRFRNYCYRYLDAYVGNSTPLIKQMHSMGLPADKCHLIHNGVLTDSFQPLSTTQKHILRYELGMEKDTYYLLFVGSLIYRKGADILVSMMEELNHTQQSVKLIIIGDHTFPEDQDYHLYASQLKERIKKKGISSSFLLTGRLSHTEYKRWLQASDIFVFPSRREGMPRVILEAMSVSLPCVCSSMEGIAYDMIEPRVTGIIIDNFDPYTYTDEVRKLINDKALRDCMGTAARQRAVEKFDETHAVDAYKRLYLEVDSQ